MAMTVTENALRRIASMRESKAAPDLKLRITVEGGGCSGFQYVFGWDETAAPGDQVFAGAVITDETSLPFLDNAVIDFSTSLMGQEFKVGNPNAVSGCGCGVSFAI